MPVVVKSPLEPAAVILELKSGHVLKLLSSTPTAQLSELLLTLESRGST